jgi:hypothetical protein
MFIIFGIIGLLIISYSVWVKNERRKDLLLILGGLSLLAYSISIRDAIFIILQIIFIISAFVAEFIQLSKKK